MKKSNLKSGSFIPDGLQTENALSHETIFGAEMAHNGFFLCTAALALEPLCSKISSGGPLEKSSWAGVCLYVCMCVCPSIFDSGAQTAGRIGKGEYSFDAPEQWKHDGNAFRTARLHVARVTCDRANPCKKVVAKGARQTNGRIQLKLGGLIATTVAVSPF